MSCVTKSSILSLIEDDMDVLSLLKSHTALRDDFPLYMLQCTNLSGQMHIIKKGQIIKKLVN
jgi:hypothetical protein